MKTLLRIALPATLLAAALALPSQDQALSLEVQYEGLQLLRMERQYTFQIETTTMEIEVDGEPMERPTGRNGGATSVTTQRAILNDYKQVTDGKPSHLVRTFEEFSVVGERGGEEREMPANPALPEDGLVIDIQKNAEGEQTIKVLEGEAPENKAFLEKQPMRLGMAGLLPEDSVEAGATWDLENKAIRRALGPVAPARIPRGDRPERPRRGGDRLPVQDGPRQDGRRRSGASGGIGAFLKQAEWSGEAKLVALDKEYEGEPCALIEIEFAANGDLPERSFGGGRGRRERSAGSAPLAVPVEGDVTIKFTGKLYYSLEHQIPLALELDGKLETTESTVRDRGERSMTMYREQEGSLRVAYTYAREDRE